MKARRGIIIKFLCPLCIREVDGTGNMVVAMVDGREKLQTRLMIEDVTGYQQFLPHGECRLRRFG